MVFTLVYDYIKLYISIFIYKSNYFFRNATKSNRCSHENCLEFENLYGSPSKLDRGWYNNMVYYDIYVLQISVDQHFPSHFRVFYTRVADSDSI